MDNIFNDVPLKIAVVGSGISGMAAAWLLSRRHDVTVFEKDHYIGGHSNTVDARTGDGDIPVDTGFIVFNEENYPNLTKLFELLEVPTSPTSMSFSASLDDGRLEYSGCENPLKLFAQRRNALNPRFWRMLGDILRFYNEAPKLLNDPGVERLSLGDVLREGGYGRAFLNDHLLPLGGAIWSTPPQKMLDYPALAFLRFFYNHGLIKVGGRPKWRTVRGGSREYVKRLTAAYLDRVIINTAVKSIQRSQGGVLIEDIHGGLSAFDHVVIAAHSDQALNMLADPTPSESRLLGDLGYQRNLAILHTDASLMPKTRRAWSSWNYIRGKGEDNDDRVCVTYWMNSLQPLATSQNLFLTLNPLRMPRDGSILRSFQYDHPVFDTDALAAQKMMWNLQGVRRTWYCGAYMGYGFHEDGLQAGLAVAEKLGGVSRPWHVAGESARLYLPESWKESAPAPVTIAA